MPASPSAMRSRAGRCAAEAAHRLVARHPGGAQRKDGEAPAS
jgi:hypothetical protein